MAPLTSNGVAPVFVTNTSDITPVAYPITAAFEIFSITFIVVSLNSFSPFITLNTFSVTDNAAANCAADNAWFTPTELIRAISPFKNALV